MNEALKPTAAETPDFLIWIVTKTLSDGSEVFNVDFNGTEIECVDEDAAEQLAQTIAHAISDHTNSTADVMR